MDSMQRWGEIRIANKRMEIKTKDNECKNWQGVRIRVSLRLSKRVIDHLGALRKKIFPKAENIELVIFSESKINEEKELDFNELRRIGSSLHKAEQKTGLKLSVNHSFRQYVLVIKQLKLFWKNSPDKPTKKQKEGQEGQEEQIGQFWIQLKNMKKKSTLGFELNEEIMLKFRSLEQFIYEQFHFNKYAKQVGQKMNFLLQIDSLNIQEIDLSKVGTDTFILFLKQLLSHIDVSKIRSVSFKATQSKSNSSLLKEYFFIFSQFLSRCSKLVQIQMIVDFCEGDICSLAPIFKHLILDSLSPKICPELRIIELSFAGLGHLSRQIVSQLSISSFIKQRIIHLKSLKVHCYSHNANQLFLGKNQQTDSLSLSVSDSLSLSVSDSTFILEESKAKSIVHRISARFATNLEVRSFLRDLSEMECILILDNALESIETISKGLQKGNVNVNVNGIVKAKESVMSLQIIQVIPLNQIEDIWTVLISELFMRCRKSIQSIECDISFQEEQTIHARDDLIAKLNDQTSFTKTQQRRPFEWMLITFLQPVTYQKLERLIMKRPIYDVMFNELLIKSLLSNRLVTIDIDGVIKNTKQYNSQQSLTIWLGTSAGKLLPYLDKQIFPQVECKVSRSNQLSLSQLIFLLDSSMGRQITSFLFTDSEVIVAKQLYFTQSVIKIIQAALLIPQITIQSPKMDIEICKEMVLFKESSVQSDMIGTQLNKLQKKYLKLYVNGNQQIEQFRELFSDFKYISIYIDNLNLQNVLPIKKLAETKNVHKIVLKGIQKISNNNQIVFFKLLKHMSEFVLIDIFLAKNYPRFLKYNSMTKFIKILQYFKHTKHHFLFRTEIFQEAINLFL